MKRTIFVIIAITLLATIPVIAQTMGNGGMGPGMMTESQQHMSNVPNEEYLRHMKGNLQNYMMMNNAYGMMGNYGMMPMMGGGYGTPPCTIGGGYNMMDRNFMMPMMGGHGMMHNQWFDNYKKYESFARETRELRRKLHNLMFDYGEARWNPETTIGDLNKMAEEINKLRQEIQKKMPQ